MVEASERIQKYFDTIKTQTKAAHALANQARKLGYDPADTVEVSLAENMAERVVGLISVLAPQVAGAGIVERIIELEKQYGVLDWRVALSIAAEIAQQKYCTFEDEKNAIEIGIRAGFAYVTVGVVSSPLDGLIDVVFKDRMDRAGKYFCLNFAGPIRNAGGTAAAVCVIIADYVRKELKYHLYDATDDEAKRAFSEVSDYAERVAPRQHNPTEEEMHFLMKHMPVEVSGDPSERFEVSNYKDLPRIPTNIIRSGFCLMLSDCIPLKAPKLWKQLGKWGKDFGMEHWNFLEKLIDIQKKAKAKGAVKTDDAKISPNYAYIKEIVAGRPVLGYPLEHGAFRLRYGRSRFGGFSAASIHPATMHVLLDYIGTGTQLKTERPGKATSVTMCDLIEGPIVRTAEGTVVQLHTLAQARDTKDIVEILYLGDILVSYGDFFNRAHSLVPAGYCEEWWVQELEKALIEKHGNIDGTGSCIPSERIKNILKSPLLTRPSLAEAFALCRTYSVALHPFYTPHWSAINTEQFEALKPWIGMAKKEETQDHITKLVASPDEKNKRSLELLGVEHTVGIDGSIIIPKRYAHTLHLSLGGNSAQETPLLRASENSAITQRDRSGTFIGSRMGRPEKAKQRKMTGSPHMSFPVGDEGGRLRSIQSCLLKKYVNADFQRYTCPACKRDTVYRVCEPCNTRTILNYYCRSCQQWQSEKKCTKHERDNQRYARWKIPINDLFRTSLAAAGISRYPELVKGVRGTSNKHHYCEHLSKGVLRAKHDVYTFKDGTTRYDMTQVPMTHFKPCEIGTPIERLRELGYTQDIHGAPLERDDQILEIFPQDIVLPSGTFSGEEGCDQTLLRVAKFADELLEKLYKLEPYYKAEHPKDLVGHLVICLAPHTSAGMVGRIIGYSNTQGFWAHPYIHAATRRDCDGDEACVVLLMDAFLNFSKEFLPQSRGGTMDAPLVLTSVLTPAEVDDMAFDVDIEWRYPLALYESALEYKKPWDVPVKVINKTLGTSAQFEGMGFTHDTTNMNNTISCSAYKTIPSMLEKLEGQMVIAEKVRAVDTTKVATLVIEKHFMKDSVGNLRKFTSQTFRCVTCNEKYRRVPLIGKCIAGNCHGKIIFTVSKGNITKYVEPTVELAERYNVSSYLKQTIEVLKLRLEGHFGKEREKQMGLSGWC